MVAQVYYNERLRVKLPGEGIVPYERFEKLESCDEEFLLRWIPGSELYNRFRIV